MRLLSELESGRIPKPLSFNETIENLEVEMTPEMRMKISEEIFLKCSGLSSITINNSFSRAVSFASRYGTRVITDEKNQNYEAYKNDEGNFSRNQFVLYVEGKMIDKPVSESELPRLINHLRIETSNNSNKGLIIHTGRGYSLGLIN